MGGRWRGCCGDDDAEKGGRGVQDRREPSFDLGLAPCDQRKWDGVVQRPHDKKRRPDPLPLKRKPKTPVIDGCCWAIGCERLLAGSR